jgi:hypothetical protein
VWQRSWHCWLHRHLLLQQALQQLLLLRHLLGRQWRQRQRRMRQSRQIQQRLRERHLFMLSSWLQCSSWQTCWLRSLHRQRWQLRHLLQQCLRQRAMQRLLSLQLHQQKRVQQHQLLLLLRL